MQEICAVFDIGKTNKKLLAFNTSFDVVYEKQCVLPEVVDEDGEACENLFALHAWINQAYADLKADTRFEILALNFSGYGASLVYIDASGKPVAPLYNYLKMFPKSLKSQFEALYNADSNFFKTTASPDLGMLNSGMQLYWLKYRKTEIFKQTKYALHFPQYLSFLFSNLAQAEYTSVGCHTALWDFAKQAYHTWLNAEHWHAAALPPVSANTASKINGVWVGAGIHDSSAALVPYLKTISEPFVLISTGTWCISINPFNDQPLSDFDLKHDCLNFISFEGKVVRASRLFSGNEHERQIKHLSTYFGVEESYYKTVKVNFKIIQSLRRSHSQVVPQQTDLGDLKDCPFVERNLNAFKTFEEAYHQFVMDLVAQQIASTKLTFGSTLPKRIYVDGGFSKNEIFMNLLSEAFLNVEVYSSEVAQASSLGAALVLAPYWTTVPIDESVFKLKRYF
jgi:L-fuculokinase